MHMTSARTKRTCNTRERSAASNCTQAWQAHDKWGYTTLSNHNTKIDTSQSTPRCT